MKKVKLSVWEVLQKVVNAKNEEKAKRNTMKCKRLEDMSHEELDQYILNMMMDWPSKLTKDERALLMHEMKAAVAQGRRMSMDHKRREEYLREKKRNRERREAFERDSSTPRLNVCNVDM